MTRIIIALVLAAHLLMPYIAYGQQVVRKGPFDYDLRYYGLVLGMALLGGFTSWYAKVKRGEIPRWSIHHLTGELTTSAFAGLLAFFVFQWLDWHPMLTAALTGISGHMGTRAIEMFETWAMKRANLVPVREP